MKYLICAFLVCFVPCVSFADGPIKAKYVNLEGRTVTLTGKISEETVKLPRGLDKTYDQFMGYILTVRTAVGTPIESSHDYRLMTKRDEEDKALRNVVGKEATIEGLDGNRSFQSYLYVITVKVDDNTDLLIPKDVKDLTESQKKFYDRIAGNKETIAISVYQLADKAEDAEKATVRFKLNGREVNIQYKGNRKGRFSSSAGSLTIKNGVAFGLIFTDNRVYSIMGLGEGMAAVVEIDQKKFSKD